jgi:uncharacterized membrane protein YeaQ/YmgE (transglycosylase-associated protein family)
VETGTYCQKNNCQPCVQGYCSKAFTPGFNEHGYDNDNEHNNKAIAYKKPAYRQAGLLYYGRQKKEDKMAYDIGYHIGYWVAFLFIGGLVGWLAGLIIRGRGFGIVADIIIGIVGATLGGWMAAVVGVSANSPAGAFLLSLVGAVVLVGLTRFAVRHSNISK